MRTRSVALAAAISRGGADLRIPRRTPVIPPGRPGHKAITPLRPGRLPGRRVPQRGGGAGQQRASYVAYESDATDIVAGGTNGVADVFWSPRAATSAWKAARGGTGRHESRRTRRRPANRPSGLPDIGGDRLHAPGCVAFVASVEPVRDDANGRADAFLCTLRTRRIERVSLATGERQSDGDTFEVQVDRVDARVSRSCCASRPGAHSSRVGRPPKAPTHLTARARSALRGLAGRGQRGARRDDGPGLGVDSRTRRQRRPAWFSKLGGAPGCTRVRRPRGRGRRVRPRRTWPPATAARCPTSTPGSFARARGTLSMRTTLVSRTRGGGAAGDRPSAAKTSEDNGAYG